MMNPNSWRGVLTGIFGQDAEFPLVAYVIHQTREFGKMGNSLFPAKIR
jgi:hypothetical protein